MAPLRIPVADSHPQHHHGDADRQHTDGDEEDAKPTRPFMPGVERWMIVSEMNVRALRAGPEPYARNPPGTPLITTLTASCGCRLSMWAASTR